MKYLKKFNESKDYYEEIPEDYFWKCLDMNVSTLQPDIVPFTNREIEIIKSICDETNTKLKAPKALSFATSRMPSQPIDLDNEVYELTLNSNVSGVGLSRIYKIKDEYFLFGFNVDRESSSTFYKADQIDGLLKLINDKL